MEILVIITCILSSFLLGLLFGWIYGRDHLLKHAMLFLDAKAKAEGEN